MGGFLLGRAKISQDFGQGMRGWAWLLSPSWDWSGDVWFLVLDCCCPEDLLPLWSSRPAQLLLTVGKLPLARATVELGRFQHPTSLGMGSRHPPPSRRAHLPAATAQPHCFLLLLWVFRYTLTHHPVSVVSS